MLTAILIPVIAALFFISAGIGWLMASIWHQSPWSHLWYGGKWAESFAPERKATTLIRASGFTAFYLLYGGGFLLMAINTIYAALRPTIYYVQWTLIALGTVLLVSALIISKRRLQM